jgi:GT2 family glycosyltransferase
MGSILEKTTYPNYRIRIVDNQSSEQATFDLFASWPAEKTEVLRDDSPFNFASLNNRAAASASEEFICLLNNDMEVLTPGWLDEMVAHAARPGIGAVGARLWYPDGTLQHAGVVLGIHEVAAHVHRRRPKGDPGYFGRAVLQQAFSAVTAACLLIRKSIYDQVGGLDERFQVAFNDIDFCLRVREAGYRNVWTPYAEFIHHESASRGDDFSPENKERFLSEVRMMQEIWGHILIEDPYYSPNLTLHGTDWGLAWPPRVSGLA